jgi:hypothetical protein
MSAPPTRSLRTYDDRALLGEIDAPPPLVRRRPDRLGLASRVVGLLLRFTLLLILLATLGGVVGLVGAVARAPSSVGEQLGGTVERSVGVVAGAVQAVRDATDPAHPPRQALAQDTEFDELIRLDVDSPIGGASNRTLVFAAVQRRDGPESPDSAVYAVIHSELVTPQETRILGVLVRTNRDPRDDYLYKGETFRVGRRLYKVNWVSLDRQQIAIAAYRDPDRVTAPLKFVAD